MKVRSSALCKALHKADYAKWLIMESNVAASGKKLAVSGLAEANAVLRLP
jgi:hypothetical protein